MSYLQDRNKNRKKKKLFVGLGLALLVIMLSLFGAFRSLAPLMHRIGLPFWNADRSLSSGSDIVFDALKSKKEVVRENKSLLDENENLKAAMLDYTILKTENENLKSLLGRIPEKENFILATVLAKPNSSPYDTLVIDVGDDAGVYVGEHVFANAEVPIGKIQEVYAHTSLVSLYSSPGTVTQAQLDGETGASIEITGRGGGNFQMMIPRDMSVVNGTAVVLPNIHSRIVAFVADVVSDPRDPLSKVILKSPVNIQELKWVQVLK